jgi:hypothetical protein
MLSGSAFVKKHPGDNLCKAELLYKATEGHIFGFEEGEDPSCRTTDPLTWIIANGKQTEVLWMDNKDFKKLWHL